MVPSPCGSAVGGPRSGGEPGGDQHGWRKEKEEAVHAGRSKTSNGSECKRHPRETGPPPPAPPAPGRCDSDILPPACSALLPSLRCACIGRVFAVWLNDLNPVALRLTDWLQVRWYGLAYVLGFVAAFLVMRWFVRRGRGVLAENDLADFVTYTALFGVMLGGRLGYMLLYDRAEFFAHPLTFFKLTSGGMASHGGILGIFIFTWVYAKRKKVSWPGLGDMLVVPAPLGIFAGRMANFINGELWGYEARGVAWAVRFPLETSTRMRQ